MGPLAPVPLRSDRSERRERAPAFGFGAISDRSVDPNRAERALAEPAGRAFLAVVCGLRSEAAALRRGLSGAPSGVEVRIGVCGADPDRAEALALGYARSGARLIVSAGLSGGLVPHLRVGDVVWGRDVAETAPAWWARTVADRKASWGIVAGADAPVLTPEAKLALNARTGALVVDMESHRVALVASRTGTPFLALRAVVDPADRRLPAVIATAVGPTGRPRVGALTAAVMARPPLLADLVRLAGASRRALAALEAEARHLPALAEAVPGRDRPARSPASA